MPPPPPSRAPNNPWPTWPKVFKMDYGHEEVELKFGRDPRIFNIKSSVSVQYDQLKILWYLLAVDLLISFLKSNSNMVLKVSMLEI